MAESHDMEDAIKRVLSKESFKLSKAEFELKTKLLLNIFTLDKEKESEDKLAKTFGRNIENVGNEIEALKGQICNIGQETKKMQNLADQKMLLRRNIADNMKSIETYIDSHVEPRMENYLKSTMNLMSKVAKQKTSYEEIDKRHAFERKKKENELKTLKDKTFNFQQEEAQIQMKAEEINKEIETVNTDVKLKEKKLEDMHFLINQIQDSEASINTLASNEIYEEEALHNVSSTLQTIFDNFEPLIKKSEETKFQLEEIEHQKRFLESKLCENEELVNFLQLERNFDEVEQNEIFVREFSSNNLYEEGKKSLEHKRNENNDIYNDVEKYTLKEKEQDELIQQLREEVNEDQSVATSLQNEINDLDQKEKGMENKFKSLTDANKIAEEKILKEISELQKSFATFTNEFEEKQNFNSKTIADLNMKLKAEKMKTKQLRLNTPTTANTFPISNKLTNLNLNSQVNSDERSLTFNNQKYKSQEFPSSDQRFSSVSNSYPHSHKLQTTSKRSFAKSDFPAERKLSQKSSEPKLVKIDNNKMKDETNLKKKDKLVNGSNDSSAYPKSSQESSKPKPKLSLAKADFPVYRKSSQELPEKKITKIEDNKMEDEKILKKNDEFFNSSNDSSFNITFNTDIDELLDNL
ncbi:CLUMA_CG006985, isoform A [Clunio marinus]|uniref:CLUMA_CG006985, isoform A n=1 Tax=Clunio marinus TaxID=568069 RepID=A0A1J1I4Z7_9DIPT|nr:CLUMA_CG006985, isoform A [Clunio marinus]